MKKYHATKDFELTPTTTTPVWLVEIHNPDCIPIAYAVGETMAQCKANAIHIIVALNQFNIQKSN